MIDMASSRIEFDTSEVNRLAVDLSRAPGRMQRKAPKVFEVAAFKIKKGMRRDAESHRYLSGLPSQLEYERFGALDYEIGYNKVSQGNLANFAAFGSINNAPILNLEGPMHREIPHMLRALADAGAESAFGDVGKSAMSAPTKFRYTTNAGKVRMASAAQINHWTRAL